MITAYVNHAIVGTYQPMSCTAVSQGGGSIGVSADPQDVDLALDDFGGGDAK